MKLFLTYNFMSFTSEDIEISEKAIEFIENHQNELIEKFVLFKKVFPVQKLAIFMAGAPGSGKTEYSKAYQQLMNDAFDKSKSMYEASDVSKYDNIFLRIDVDEIREFIPQYVKTDIDAGTKGNAHVINRAATKGLDIIRQYCIEHKVPFLLDGTFGNYFSAINRLFKILFKQNRKIAIFFVYVNPVTSWEFTKKREYLEGRNVTKENFIRQYFKSIDNIKRIKAKFGNQINLTCILKDNDNQVKRILFNESSLDEILKIGGHDLYTQDKLFKILEDNIVLTGGHKKNTISKSYSDDKNRMDLGVIDSKTHRDIIIKSTKELSKEQDKIIEKYEKVIKNNFSKK